jgi:hypothetical protein
VLPPSIWSRLTRHVALLLAFTAVFAVLLLSGSGPPDEPLPDSVGVIDGESINVTGPMSVEVVHGQVKTILRSGSDVRVKSGAARIDLVEGGQISICGPAHLSVLKSGAALTVALDTGAIHVHLPAQAGVERAPALTIYTPQIQAQTVPIGDGPQDVVVGFDAQGAMCLRANRGAIRAEQQLTGHSVLIPQASDVLIVSGQLDGLISSAGHCDCELQLAKGAPPVQATSNQVATVDERNTNTPTASADAAPATPNLSSAKEAPIYQVYMPPLIYDAKAKVQPEIDPQLIVLARRVRVRPTLIFQGRVEGELVAAVTPPSAPASASNAQKPPAPANDSFVGRVRSFVRKLWSRGS